MSWIPYDDARTKDELKEHYLIEKELAHKLSSASKHERIGLYSAVYDELFVRVPKHSQILAREDDAYQRRRAEQKMRLVRRFVDEETVFLEVGCGDGSFSQYVAPAVKSLYALDVSQEIVQQEKFASNISFILSDDGVSIPLEDASVDVVYSNQLMEHLHPDDALEQLRSISRVLSDTGKYICLTPNAISGPHDISQYFSDVAEGFHLKEYSWKELRVLLQSVGFQKFSLYAGGLGWYIRTPEWVVIVLEWFLQTLPRPLWRVLSRTLVCKAFLGINVVASK